MPLISHLTCQVWDYNRSAEMRDTEGGVSKRSVLEQVCIQTEQHEPEKKQRKLGDYELMRSEELVGRLFVKQSDCIAQSVDQMDAFQDVPHVWAIDNAMRVGV